MTLQLNELEILAKSDAELFAEAVKPFGLQVVGQKTNDPLNKEIQEEVVSAMASAITEDVNRNAEMTSEQKAIYSLAENYGYIVVLS